MAEKVANRARHRGQVLAVDDQVAFRRSLRSLIEATPALVLVGEAQSGEDAIPLVADLTPDLVFMDVRMPGIGGIRAARQIKRLWPHVTVILVSTTHPDDLPAAAHETSADGIVWKCELRPKLIEEIWARHEVARG
jgi:DNA-binding NarL/FixJ family response regulator